MSNTGKVVMALSWLALGGCYTYVPANGDLPPAGKEVRAHLEPSRSFPVGEITVERVTRVDGIMYIPAADTIAVWSSWFHTAFGTRFYGSNAVIYIPRSDIPQLEVRKLHAARTVATLGATVVLGAGFLNLLSNPTAEGVDGGGPPITLGVTVPFGGR